MTTLNQMREMPPFICSKVAGEINFSSKLPYISVRQRTHKRTEHIFVMFSFVCVEVLRPSQSNGVMSSAVSLPIHTFTGQA